MRPKKLVLVLEPNDNRLGILMFTLSVNGYKVVGAHTVLEADAIAKENVLDAVFMETDSGFRLRDAPTVVKGSRDMWECLAILRIIARRNADRRKELRRQRRNPLQHRRIA